MARKQSRKEVPSLGAWPQDDDGKDLKFLEHEELKAIADDVIEECHDDLINVNFRYVFVKEQFTVAGSKRMGKVTKLGGLNRDLFQTDAIVKVAWEAWSKMERATKVAFMDHLLSHLERNLDNDSSGVLKYRSPDVAEFPAVIRRHGAWWEGLKKLGYEIQQLRIAFEEPVEEDESADDDDGVEPRDRRMSSPVGQA